jgi:hypothetical protein
MMPLETATTIRASQVRQQRNQQRKPRHCDVTAVKMKALDRHIETLEAKLSFLIRSCDVPCPDLLYQYGKRLSTVKQEIDEATECRRYQMG